MACASSAWRIRQRFFIGQRQRLLVLAHQEEPVAAPGDIAMHHAVARYLDRHPLAIAVGGHVAHGDRAVVMENGTDLPHRGVDAMGARRQPAEMVKRRHQPDGAVAAHAQVARVVEEAHPAAGLRRDRLAVERPHQHVVAARFE